jgi:hypothetical protein
LNKPLRRKIGAGGRKFVEENLKWGKIAGKLLSFYLTVLDKPKPRYLEPTAGLDDRILEPGRKPPLFKAGG